MANQPLSYQHRWSRQTMEVLLLWMQFDAETVLYCIKWLTTCTWLYKVYRVWLCPKCSTSNITMSTSCWKSICTFTFIKNFTFDLRFDLKDLVFEEKCGFEIWLNDFNTFLEISEIRVRDLIWDLPITSNYLHYKGCIPCRPVFLSVFFLHSEREPLEISGTDYFTGYTSFLSPNQQRQSTDKQFSNIAVQ